MSHSARILIVEDEKRWQLMLTAALDKAGCEVEQAYLHGEALVKLARLEFELAIVDLRLSGTLEHSRFEGEEILDELKRRGIFCMVVTARSTPSQDRKLVERYGQYGLLTILDKLRFADDGFRKEEFPEMVLKAVEKARQARRADGLADDQLNRLAQIKTP